MLLQLRVRVTLLQLHFLEFETSNSKSEVSKSNLRKITPSGMSVHVLSQKLHYSEGAVSHQPIPLLIINKGFMIIIILSNYQ